MLNAILSEPAPVAAAPTSPAGAVFMKNMSYTYAWYYQPLLPVRLA